MWNLGPIPLHRRTILAPMAGVSDRATRTVYRRLGTELSWTEMISAQGLVRDDPKTYTYLDIVAEEPPVIVQIFGREPEAMADAARICVAAGAQGVDVNMGCPVQKVFKNGCGVALMGDTGRAAAIIAAMREAVGPEVAVTAKFRAGITGTERNCIEFARRLDEAGADALSLHPRTREEMFAEHSDWGLIAAVKSEVGCAVIGSGDVAAPEDAVRMREETGCDAVMIARAAQGNPWLIPRCDAALEGRPVPPEPTLAERCRVLMEHARLAATLAGEAKAMREMRKQVGWYLSGQRGAKQVRAHMSRLHTLSDLRDVLAGVLRHSPEPAMALAG